MVGSSWGEAKGFVNPDAKPIRMYMELISCLANIGDTILNFFRRPGHESNISQRKECFVYYNKQQEYQFLDIYAKQIGLKVKGVRGFFFCIKKTFLTSGRTILPPPESPPPSPISQPLEAVVQEDANLWKVDLTKFLAKRTLGALIELMR